jgi:excisionase family DNA binding protein
MQNESKFLTVDEAAHLVSLSHWTIRVWLQRGRLTRYKAGPRTVVSRPELLAMVEPRKIEGVDRVLHEHAATFHRHFLNHVRKMNR